MFVGMKPVFCLYCLTFMRKLQEKLLTNPLSQTKKLKQTISYTQCNEQEKYLKQKKPVYKTGTYMWVYKK